MPSRERRAKALGVSVDQLPDGRGRHGNHAFGPGTARWNEGITHHPSGYLKIQVGKQHSYADPNGYAYLHTLVWLAAGYPLAAGVLHHINEVKTDNRIENLTVVSRSEHNREHPLDRHPATGKFIGKKAAVKFHWKAPRAMEGEEWCFYDHPRNGVDGPLLRGKVMLVQTHYAKGEAYHIFHMRVPSYVRRRVVGEDSLQGPV